MAIAAKAKRVAILAGLQVVRAEAPEVVSFPVVPRGVLLQVAAVGIATPLPVPKQIKANRQS